MASRRLSPLFLSVIAVSTAIGGCTTTDLAPPTSQATVTTALPSTSTSTSMPSSRVTGPDPDGTYTAVLAAADVYERCWEERQPDEYLLAVQAWSFGLTPPELSHVIDGVAQPTEDAPGTTASTRPRTGETDPAERLPTVEDAFARIVMITDQGPDGLSVVFDQNLCHPTTIGVNSDVDTFDDEVTFEYTVIPTGKGDVDLVTVTSATVAGRSYRVELDDGTVFNGDPFVWEACRDPMPTPCGALVVRDATGQVVHSVAAVPDESTGWWRLPTFGAVTVDEGSLILWEGAAFEIDAAFGPLTNGEEAACQSFMAGEAVRAELFIDPSTLRAVGYTCW